MNTLVLLYAFGLLELTNLPSARWAFRAGFSAGMLVFALQLFWLWNIFGPVSMCLWAVLSLFHGLFVLAVQAWRRRFGNEWLWVVVPCFWMALEYFRSELYYLKFSWLSVGYVFSMRSGIFPVGILGVYGSGFVVFFLAAVIFGSQRRLGRSGTNRAIALVTRYGPIAATICVLGVAVNFPTKLSAPATTTANQVHVAGVQLEFPPELEVPRHLDAVLKQFPETDLIVLSEYTFDAGVPARVRDWCKAHGKYLMAGGKDDSGNGRFYNTVFVVSPEGEVIFKQAKSVPIQFFRDGLPAPSQKLWDSPWGKIGVCICYDLSYRRVVDRLVKQGAQALIVPFMDLMDWGEHEHQLHSLVSPLRAKEYGIPVFRTGSSGISQFVDAEGRVMAQGNFGGQGEIIGGTVQLRKPRRLPLDHWLAPACVIAAMCFAASISIKSISGSKKSQRGTQEQFGRR